MTGLSKTEVLILSILHFDLKIRYLLFLLNSTFRRFKTGIKNIFPDCRRLLQEYVRKQHVKNRYLNESDKNFTWEKVTNQNFYMEVQGYCKVVPTSTTIIRNTNEIW